MRQALTAMTVTLQLAGVSSGQVTSRVSVSSTGEQANGESAPWTFAISANSRFVVFDSSASNLVNGDTNDCRDIFVHDRQIGETTRVNVSSEGLEANAQSQNASISADGRFIAFDSSASNLVSEDSNLQYDVFVHDRQTGQTTRVSVSSDGAQGEIGHYSIYPTISADGRYVAFESVASNLVLGDTNGNQDIFVHDRNTGQTTRVSVSTEGVQSNGYSQYGAISADGRFVAFASSATNLVSGDTNGCGDVFVHDRQTGHTTRVSVNSAGVQGDSDSLFPCDLSSDGRFAVFSSYASNLVVDDSNSAPDVFMHDLQTGQTRRVSVSSEGTQANNASFSPSISADGRFVTFASNATTLVFSDTNDWHSDVFVHNTESGRTCLASVSHMEEQGNSDSYYPRVSSNGRLVAFTSDSTNLVPGDSNGYRDIFVRDVACSSDGNMDGVVDGLDLSVLLGQFGQFVVPSTDADFNGDGVVDGRDLSVLLANFGGECQ